MKSIKSMWEKWLKETNVDIKYQPYIYKYCSKMKMLIIKYKGLNPLLSLVFNKSGNADIAIGEPYENCDLAYDASIQIQKKNKQYYCDLCSPEWIKYYDSRYEFWKDHVFDDIQNWINKLDPNSKIVIKYDIDDKKHITDGSIKRPEQLTKKALDFYDDILPLVITDDE